MHCKMLLKYLPMQDMLLGPTEGLFSFTAWKYINFHFSHQNHYKLHVKVKIHSQTCRTNSPDCVQSCIEACKQNMTWVMLDMDNSAPLPGLCSVPCWAFVCRALCWADGRARGRGPWLQKLNIFKWLCASCDPSLWQTRIQHFLSFWWYNGLLFSVGLDFNKGEVKQVLSQT